MLVALAYLGGFLVGATFLAHVYFARKSHKIYEGKHVVVTGGSQGLGKELAKEYFRFGARVTIMARTQSKLDAAKKDIEALKSAAPATSCVETVAVDVTDAEAVRKAMATAVERQGGEPIYTLVACAGRATPGYFLEQDASVFKQTMEINYLGPVHCAKAVAQRMVDDKVQGELILVSSAAAAASFIGYASYAPTKSALRGLADALRNELRGFGIRVHIAYPPDTDTPGFEEENKSKPVETTQVSPPEVYSAKAVAEGIVDGVLRGEYHLQSPDVVQNLLVSTTANITPRGRWAALELALAPVLGLVMLAFKYHADRVASRYGERVLAGRR